MNDASTWPLTLYLQSGHRNGSSQQILEPLLVSTLYYDGIPNVVRCTMFHPKLRPSHTTRYDGLSSDILTADLTAVKSICLHSRQP